MPFIELNQADAAALQIFTECNENQLRHYYEPFGGLFLAESAKVTARALAAGYRPHSVLVERKFLKGEAGAVIESIGDPDLPVYVTDHEHLLQVTHFNLTSGMLCAMHRRELPSVEEVCRGARRIAILERVTNPTNVGAIFRSAAAMFMDAVLITDNCSDPLYRRAARVSMGNVFQIPWTCIPTENSGWPDRGMQLLHELGFQTAAMALKEDSLSIADSRLKEVEKLAVLLGAEGDGLAQETIDACDYTVKIPMSHDVDSLNVAAASAVAFWELSRPV